MFCVALFLVLGEMQSESRSSLDGRSIKLAQKWNQLRAYDQYASTLKTKDGGWIQARSELLVLIGSFKELIHRASDLYQINPTALV